MPKDCQKIGQTIGEVAEQIYAEYPRKVGKGAAIKAICKALVRLKTHHEDPAAWLKERVAEYAASRKGEEQKFTPHPSTWFNEERYDDPIVETKRQQQKENPLVSRTGLDASVVKIKRLN